MADSIQAFVVLAAVVVFGLVYTLITWTFNVPIGFLNDCIDSGLLSQDTATHFGQMLDMWRIAPFFFIVGLILFVYARSKGDAVFPSAYFSYMLLMIITLVISAYWVMAIGISVDAICAKFNTVDWIVNVPPVWDSSSERMLCIALIYYFAMAPGFIGTALYVLYPINKQVDNTVLDPEDLANGEEMVTPYQLQQM